MKRAATLITLFAVVINLNAQKDQERRDKRSLNDRIWYGGGVGLGLGTVTNIQANPMIGYKIDQQGMWSAGIGASYMYQRNNLYNPPLTFSAYGYRTFTRYRFLDHFFAHAEFLHLNLQAYDQLYENFGRIWVPHVLLGGGYVQQGGGRGSLYLQVLVEVLQDPNSIYRYQQGPIISAGFGIGF